MGSKEKYWFTQVQTGRQWLMKVARENTGEHWSEKIAGEVAMALDIPCGTVNVGVFDERFVSLTESVLGPGESLVHGNELLSMLDPGYPKSDSNYRTKQHTLLAVREALQRHSVGVKPQFAALGLDAFGLFVGYLLLDALVCNTDRHHENWAAVSTKEGSDRALVLAPSYDHASSLGRELTDARRRILLTTKDTRGNLAAYCTRATSALFPEGGTSKPLSSGLLAHQLELLQDLSS